MGSRFRGNDWGTWSCYVDKSGTVQNAAWASVPVIMLTSRSQERDVVRALDAGASEYIVKPFKPEELRARIKRLMRKSP